MNILELFTILGRVEKLTDRDRLIMMHAYELGFREGATAVLNVAAKEGSNAK